VDTAFPGLAGEKENPGRTGRKGKVSNMAGYKGWAGGHEVDWKKIDSGSPTPLERGIYNAVVIKAEPQETKNGKPALSIELQVESKYKDDSGEVRRKLFDTFTMTAEGLFKTKQFCDATGIEPPATTSYGDVCEFAEDMINAEVYVLVGTRTWEGKARNRVEFFIADEEVEDVYARESSDPSGGGKARRGRGRREEPASEPAERPSRRRRAEAAPAPETNGKGHGTEEIDDAEEKPRRARRRRAQAEQG
jgi:hypothetical protein